MEQMSPPRLSVMTETAGAAAEISTWSIYDAEFFDMPWLGQNIDEGLLGFLEPGRSPNGSLSTVPLFPMNDQTTWPSAAGGLNGS